MSRKQSDRAANALQQWTEQRPDIDGLVMGIIGRMAEANQLAMRKYIEPFMARHGINFGEFDVLATLRRSGSPYSLSPTELYRATMVTSGAMTGRIDRLEKAGLVKRTNTSADRRSIMVSLTPKGVNFINELLPAHVLNEEQIIQGLSTNERQILYKLLGKLLETMP